MKTKLSLLFCCFYFVGMTQIPTTDLVGFWPFNGNANEYFVGENNGTINGALLTTDRCGNENSAYLFDGIDDFILCGTDSMGVTDQVSISCWIKKDNGSTDIAVSKHDDEFADTGYNLQFDSDGAPQIRGRDRSGEFSESGNNGISLDDDEWYHVVGIVNGSVWSVYVDTVLIGTYDNGHTSAYIGGSDKPLTFGRRSYFEPGLPWNYFNGTLDDIAIYKRAISKNEIKDLFNNNCSLISKVNENYSPANFEIYPNPSSSGFVYFNSSEPVKNILVYDYLGREIQNKKFQQANNGNLDLSVLPAGTYVLQIEFESHVLVQRIIFL